MQKSLTATETNREDRAERYAQAAAMLRQWLVEADQEDDAQYDWEAIEQELQDSTMTCQDVEPHASEDP